MGSARPPLAAEAWCRLATGARRNSALLSAHGLRSGYFDRGGQPRYPLPEAMQQSLYKSVAQAARYYNNAERKMGRVARLII